MRCVGSGEEQLPAKADLRAWEEKRFKGTLFESSRVQSEPECCISWGTFSKTGCI